MGSMRDVFYVFFIALFLCVDAPVPQLLPLLPSPHDRQPTGSLTLLYRDVHASQTAHGMLRTAQAQPAPTTGGTPHRMALVIGNATYGATLGSLRNPGNDADDMAMALQQLGFTVTLLKDATRQQMEEGVKTFVRRLSPRSMGLFYFAGHGVQVDGVNYLVPVDARLEKAVDIKFQAVAAEWILARMEGASSVLNILILDACRNNPFMHQGRTVQRGLAPMQSRHGSLIAYATAPGSIAADGTERNGLYTKHLLRMMKEPNVPVEQMFKRVRIAIEKETHGAQTPWEASSLRVDFAFHPTTSLPRSQVTDSSHPELPDPVPVSPTRNLSQEPPTLTGRDGTEMLLIPAGPFAMGSDATEIEVLARHGGDEHREHLMAETPKHYVIVEKYYIDAHPVTNAAFQQFVQATGHRTSAEREGWGGISTGKTLEKVKGATWRAPQGVGSSLGGREAHPVVQVSWEDAKAYCSWVSKRLPTEAEWEKAARGTDGRPYPWGQRVTGGQANFCDQQCDLPGRDATVNDGYRLTAPVNSYESGKSPYGAYDMAGNVWEWVADWYQKDYYTQSPSHNPPGPVMSQSVVVRGGAWSTSALFLRTTARGFSTPTSRSDALGFRCVRPW